MRESRAVACIADAMQRDIPSFPQLQCLCVRFGRFSTFFVAIWFLGDCMSMISIRGYYIGFNKIYFQLKQSFEKRLLTLNGWLLNRLLLLFKSLGTQNQENEYSHKPERPQNHNTKQAMEQQKETEIKKTLSYALSRQKCIALFKELKMPPLNTPGGSNFHRRRAAGINDPVNLSVLQRENTKGNSPRAAKIYSDKNSAMTGTKVF